jgi:hypothetical protein
MQLVQRQRLSLLLILVLPLSGFSDLVSPMHVSLKWYYDSIPTIHSILNSVDWRLIM